MTTSDKDRAAFEAWARKHHANGAYFTPQMDLSRVLPSSFAVWQAATAAERERAAQVCENRAGPQGTGAFQILMSAADAIRSGE